GDFTVKELTKLVEEKTLSVASEDEATIWNKWVPKKVNIFVWRALQGRLPVREELDKRGIVPKAVLMKSGIKTLNTARQNFSKAAVSVNTVRPINTAYPRPTMNSAKTASNVFNIAHTHVRRPFNKTTTNKNSNLKEKVNIVMGNVTTAGPKVVVSDNKGNETNDVKPQHVEFGDQSERF
ncbi:putative ribonuclease H-like domain-containing protein, partial [Tanacetum coccineum]